MLTHDQCNGWQIHFKANDIESLKVSILHNLEYRLAKDHFSATDYDKFLSTAYAILERLIERWIVTQQTLHHTKHKRVYYFSMEFLMGRTLGNSLINLGLYDTCKQSLEELGIDLEEIRDEEVDAALGNGGLGRLAACFLDSLATMNIPAHGYGLRYDYGLFNQQIVNGKQVEKPDNWLALPNPWEIARPELLFKVRFGGRAARQTDHDGRTATRWLDAEEIQAMAYDTPVPGYRTEHVNTLRLWTARATEEFNLEYFNCGDYMSACERKVVTENITKVLYPNDNLFLGKELRLKQEYFLVSASLQDIIRRFKNDFRDWDEFPDAVAIQLNDTHPALAIPELLHILIDEERLEWDRAWNITTRTFAYTNHTVMPEALEEWPVQLLEMLLPRHMEIIYAINHAFLKDVARKYPGDTDRLRRMSLIAEDGVKRVRMAYLATVGSHRVNGVAELHSRILRDVLFKDFVDIWPEKFTNVTNGVTPRRWMRKANPALSELITSALGSEDWVKDLDLLRGLEAFADDRGFQEQWRRTKQQAKSSMAEYLRAETGVIIDPSSLVDIQVKRIHEYKRQLLFALYMVAQYLRIKDNPQGDFVPRTCLVGGKAAPSYFMAKLSIHLINRIAEVVNHDPDVNGLLRVAFLPNYRVSLAEKIIPAANLSEQISTAGREASGTGNMKFALNGAVTIGTLDGANVEIMEEVGPENIFIFGLTADEVVRLQQQGYRPADYIARSPELQRVLHLLNCDFFSPGEPGLFRPIYDALVNHDPFFLLADFDSYLAAQSLVSTAFLDDARWMRMSILNVARCGKFSSDRTIREYADRIWDVKPVTLPTVPTSLEPAILMSR